MNFWIVTPSFNQLEWLKLCIASIRDQPEDGITVHHHVQDACSSDGTQEYLADYAKQTFPPGYSFSYASEPDAGMYDAINRGWLLAPDETNVIAHLNCDEQYLPDALKQIAAALNKRPHVDVLLADLIVVDRDGNYVCHRRSIKPTPLLSRFCCVGMTATTFHRAHVIQQKKVLFDTSWRNIGDKVRYNDLHKAGCRFGVENVIVATFADTGANLNWTEEGAKEKRQYEREFLMKSSFGVSLVSRYLGLRRYIKEKFYKPPEQYRIYSLGKSERKTYSIVQPKCTWNKHFPDLSSPD